jgi:C4-dicarboxylate-specific signal transduction histidine kinase
VSRPKLASDSKASLEDRLQFETLISHLSSRFVNVPPNEMDATIEDTLRSVCEFLAIDLGVLWQWRSTDQDSLMPTHAYVRKEKGIPPPSEPLHHEQYPWVVEQILEGRMVVVPSLDALPEEAAVDRQSAAAVGIRSNLTFPLALAGEFPVGALAFNTVLAERDWPDSVVMRLRLVAQVLTNALSRSRHDEQRKWSKARLAAGAQLAGLGFYEVNLEQRTAYFDEPLRDLCGLPPDREVGLEPLAFWAEHLHPEDRGRVLEDRRQLHEGAYDTISVEYRFQHPERGERWLHHRAGVFRRDASGQAIATFGVLRDVSERHQAAEEARQNREEIAHLARVALAGELSGTLAHELNQPLGAILSNAQAVRRIIAQQEPDWTEVRVILDDIIADDKRAADIIVHLRELLRRGDGSLGSAAVSLQDVVRRVLQLVHREAVERGIVVRTEFETPEIFVRGDSVQLEQVVLNLVMNAFDAMSQEPAGSPVLAIRIEPLETGGVRVSVSDTGTGIAPELEGRIFEPFMTTRSRGMGMGLAICRTIVGAHGGSIGGANNEGAGATFHFILPGISPPG